MSVVTVKDNQNVFDVALQEFGTLEQIYTLLADNALSANSKLKSGQELTANKVSVGDEDIKNFVVLRDITYNNDQGVSLPPLIGGDFNNDFNIDYL